MKKILPTIIMILLATSVWCAGNDTSLQFDKIKFEEILPSGWVIKDINNNHHPYGFLEDDNNHNGLYQLRVFKTS